jgi:hypothetical protein
MQKTGFDAVAQPVRHGVEVTQVGVEHTIDHRYQRLVLAKERVFIRPTDGGPPGRTP